MKISKKLISKTIEPYKHWDNLKIHLTVNKQNTNTIDAYKKIGFNITDDFVKDIGEGSIMNHFIMTWHTNSGYIF